MITVVNMKKEYPSEPYDFKIDRSSPVGNNFYMGSESERGYVCDMYEEYFNSKLKNSDYVLEMAAAYKKYGKLRLFCWCSPKRCHGETIKQFIYGVVGIQIKMEWREVAP